MASACVTMSPRISFSHDEPSNVVTEKPDLDLFGEFEFRLEDPVTMLPADELFSDGKLVPSLQMQQQLPTVATPPAIRRRTDISVSNDPYLFSPKAPTCSIHWKQLLRLKKLYQKTPNGKLQVEEEMENGGNKNVVRSLKNFLPRSSKSDSSVNVPLLKENEVSISTSRLSLSSSSSVSSGHEVEENPRLSLDSDKHSVKCSKSKNQVTTNTSLPRLKVGKLKEKQARGNQIRKGVEISEPVQHVVVSAESPRMNPSGKIVFQSLERSSSSPSTFNGAPRYKHRGVERSYSEKVRITPVLNVPVGSLSRSGVFGIPLFSSSSSSSSSQQKRVVQQSHSKKSVERKE